MKFSSARLEIHRIVADTKSTAALPLWRTLAHAAAADLRLPPDAFFHRLLDHERRHASGIGDGVAIAALRLDHLVDPYILFARAAHAIPLATVDRHPVDLFFLMLSPAHDPAGHLQRLSALSRMMRDDQFRMNLRGVANADGLAALLLTAPAVTRAA